MPQPRHRLPDAGRAAADAADALIGVAPLISRWIERLIANQEPPLTLTQLLTLRTIAAGVDSGADLARSAAVSGAAVSQLLGGLVEGGLLERSELATDRRRSTLALSERGERTLASINRLLRTSLASALAELPHPEADALARALPHVSAVLSGVAPPRRPPRRRPGPPLRPGPPPGHPRP